MNELQSRVVKLIKKSVGQVFKLQLLNNFFCQTPIKINFEVSEWFIWRSKETGDHNVIYDV